MKEDPGLVLAIGVQDSRCVNTVLCSPTGQRELSLSDQPWSINLPLSFCSVTVVLSLYLAMTGLRSCAGI